MYSYWFGMNIVWWFFWAALIVAFFAFLTPVPRARARAPEDPFSILRRRYAAGEIATAEFDERRSRLLETAGGGEVADRAPRGTTAPPHAGRGNPGERIAQH